MLFSGTRSQHDQAIVREGQGDTFAASVIGFEYTFSSLETRMPTLVCCLNTCTMAVIKPAFLS